MTVQDLIDLLEDQKNKELKIEFNRVEYDMHGEIKKTVSHDITYIGVRESETGDPDYNTVQLSDDENGVEGCINIESAEEE